MPSAEYWTAPAPLFSVLSFIFFTAMGLWTMSLSRLWSIVIILGGAICTSLAAYSGALTEQQNAKLFEAVTSMQADVRSMKDQLEKLEKATDANPNIPDAAKAELKSLTNSLRNELSRWEYTYAPLSAPRRKDR